MKHLFIFCCLFLCAHGTVLSQERHTTPSSQRHSIDKARSDSLAAHIPRATGFINDYASLFSLSQARTLDSLASRFEKSTTVEMALATVTASMVKDEDFEDYALVMLRKWGVGKKGKNNGILIVISPVLRRMRIQNGNGVEKVLSDAETKYIVDHYFIPRFKNGNYFEGARDGMVALIQKLTQKRR